MKIEQEVLIAAALAASEQAYAPYSNFRVGAALAFADGHIVTGANVENASYGLTLCAEAVAVAKSMNEGRRDGLIAVAVIGPSEAAVPPCGRCRQMLSELAQLSGTDPIVWSAGTMEVLEQPLSVLLPHAFGPGNLN